MVDYRGTDKQDVINSLRQAETFLRQLDLGPATVKVLDDWLAKAPYSIIESATTREALAKAMAKTGSTTVFLRSEDIFIHHALVDTDGVGRKVYEDLGVWGGFSGFEMMDYRPTEEEEEDAHLVIEYIKMVAAFELKGQLPPKVLEKYKEDFLQMSIKDRGEFKRALYKTTGLAEKRDAMETMDPFDMYGIPVEAMSDPTKQSPPDIQELTMSLLPLGEQMRAILAPFVKTDEVESYGGDHAMVAMGPITDDYKNMGLLFIATKPAAQAVADHLPEYKLINQDGIRVKPAAPKQAKRPRPPGL